MAPDNLIFDHLDSFWIVHIPSSSRAILAPLSSTGEFWGSDSFVPDSNIILFFVSVSF